MNKNVLQLKSQTWEVVLCPNHIVHVTARNSRSFGQVDFFLLSERTVGRRSRRRAGGGARRRARRRVRVLREDTGHQNSAQNQHAPQIYFSGNKFHSLLE